MKLLHTADWHLGKHLEGRSRHDEQVDVLREICEIAEREDVDAVILAGDVYDTYNPPAEAETLYYRTVIRLIDGGRRPVVVIAGNHDSPDRLKASDPYGRALGVVTLGYPEEVIETFDHGPEAAAVVETAPSFLRLRLPRGEHLNIVALPYPSEARLGRLLSERLDDEDAGTHYERAVGELMARGAEGFVDGEANVVMSHLFVAGGKESESERKIQVGGAHSVYATTFPESASYVALGHLHRPQEFAGHNETPVRYAGSPLAYSFSEAGQQKSVTIVEIEGDTTTHRTVDLTSGRPLVSRKGLNGVEELERFLAETDPEAWIAFEVTLDEALEIGFVEKMHNVHPGILIPNFRYHDVKKDGDDRPMISELPIREQFTRFVRERQGEEPSDEVIALFMQVVGEG